MDDLRPVDGHGSGRVVEADIKGAGTESLDVAGKAVAILHDDKIGLVCGECGGRRCQKKQAEVDSPFAHCRLRLSVPRSSHPPSSILNREGSKYEMVTWK